MSAALPPMPVIPKAPLDRLLGLVAEVHPGEAVTAFLLAVDVFLLFAAYYILKPTREALILTGGGADVKSYSGAVQAALLLLIVPAYGGLASRVNRIQLINAVSAFFISNLVVFFLLGRTQVPLGVAFFLWVGFFNVIVVAKFWSFANDLYTPEQGKRLFAIVGVGSALGSIAGSGITSTLVRSVGVDGLLLVSAGILVLCMLLANAIHLREKDRAAAAEAKSPLGPEGGFKLVMRHRYLLFIGFLTLTIQLFNTNGEYMLAKAFSTAAHQAVENGLPGGLSEAELITRYYAVFQFWQNILVGTIQFFLVFRIIKYLGIRGALFVSPAVALSAYGLVGIAPALGNIRLAKTLENSNNYSLDNTVRHTLFLPTSREAKYKAKQVVDSFFWRAGDMVSALLVFMGMHSLALGRIATVNTALIAVWLLLAAGIAREHRKLTAASGPEVA